MIFPSNWWARQELEPQMEALQHGDMVVVTADAQWRLVETRWLVGKCSVPRCHVLTNSGGESVSSRLKFNKSQTETKTETLFKMFFGGFGPPSLVVLTVKHTLNNGWAVFFQQLKGGTPSFCTLRVVQFGCFFVPCLCLCSFHLFANWEDDVWPRLFHQVHQHATLRKPIASHETTRSSVSPWDQRKPIAVDFQMFHLQELLGVKSLHSEISHGAQGYKWANANEHASWSWSVLLR